MIDRVREGFIPVALKAGTVQRHHLVPGIEGKLYAELRRTQPLAQGIGVMNSAGKVLAWVLSFDDDPSVPGFFDHAKRLYAANADSAVATERYQRFPSARVGDAPDSGERFEVPLSHGDDEECPVRPRIAPGAIGGRIVGRALGDDGTPVSDARTQDTYVEDILEFSEAVQKRLLLASRAGGRFLVPEAFAREIVGNAYLGMLDVNPLGGDAVRAETSEETLELWAEKAGDGRLLVSGISSVKGKNREGNPRDAGRIWSHSVRLEWRGFVDLDERGVSDLVLMAEGREVLNWGGPGSAVPANAAENPAAHLLSGRPLAIDGEVRYGVTARRD